MADYTKIFRGKSVLVVDDQKFIRSMVSGSLRGLGFGSVLEASDGFNALQILGGGDDKSSFSALLATRPDIAQDLSRSRQNVDCIVTDIRMSPMNGLELLKAIRCGLAGSSRDLPVVVMSAHADDELIGAAIALDASGFVVKPTSQDSIASKLARALGSKLAVKPVDMYKGLFVPEVDEKHFQYMDASSVRDAMAAIRANDVATLKGQVAIDMRLADLQLEDVITENINSDGGAMVVPAGTTVKQGLLDALLDLSSMTKLPEMVKVKRKTI